MNVYLFGYGYLAIKHSTFIFHKRENNDKKTVEIPLNDVESVYVFGKITLSGETIKKCMSKDIPIHIFNSKEHYVGSFLPKRKNVSGKIAVEQVKHYLEKEKRIYLAKSFVVGAIKSARRLLLKKGKKIDISKYLEKINLQKSSIFKIMEIEGEFKKYYYSLLFGDKWTGRNRRPPKDKINAILSFSYSLLYTSCISAIYRTNLLQEVSFLHEPSERRFSLSLDISEVFKPYFSDRLAIKFFNNSKSSDFINLNGAVLLSDNGRKRFISLWDSFLEKSVFYPKMSRHVKMKEIILFEAYKLQKHFLGIEKYLPFSPWW